MMVQSVDAILLSGGSAFGLAAADGVMQALAAAGRGVPTPGGPVPIVPAAVIFDLAVGRATHPGPDQGRAAFDAAVPIAEARGGSVGAGRGATVGKLFAPDQHTPGGVGIASVEVAGGSVAAVVVVNAAGLVGGGATDLRPLVLGIEPQTPFREATTLAVVIIDAPVNGLALQRAAVAAHDGLARTIVPCHTLIDGDVVFAVGTDRGEPTPQQVVQLSVAAEMAIERAVVNAVGPG